jgi:hypothetical protein
MSLDIADLVTVESRDEVLATLLSVSALLGAPTTSWQEGAPILTLLTTVSQKIADLTVLATDITKGGFGELLPSDSWADRWALSRFNVTRIPAVAASGFVDLTNSTITQHDLAIGELIVAHATTGKTYRNTAPISVLASVGLADVAIAADEPGTASNAAPGAITVVVSGGAGIGCTNAASVLGTDQETTTHLVTRARSKLASLSPNGPKDAYNYVATTPFFPDGTPCSPTSVPITRTRTVADEATGIVTVYCATASGAPSGADIDIVQSAFDAFVEPWGVTSVAVAATPHVIAPTYHAWLSGTNLTTGQIETVEANALALYFATIPLGGVVIPPDTGDVYVEAIEQVIGQAVPGTVRVVVSIPSAKVDLTPDEVAVLGTISPTITLL